MKTTKVTSLLLALTFVVLWSSGAIFAKLGLAYTQPLTFLMWRFGFASLLLLVLCFSTHATWPHNFKELYHISVSGILLQTFYQIGCFQALYFNVAPGLFATILGAQPMLTALICRLYYKEIITTYQYGGLLLGFLGLGFITFHTLTRGLLTIKGLSFLLLGLFGITIGSIYQKKHCISLDPRTCCSIQYLISTVLVTTLAIFYEPLIIHWTGKFILAITWMVFPISVGAMLILYALIKKGDMTQVASLFYLMPPFTAIMGYVVFGETLNHSTLLGMSMIIVAIALVNNFRSVQHSIDNTLDNKRVIK